LVANCTGVGCHAGTRPKDGLSLEAGVAYGELVGAAASQCDDARQLVAPGDSANSYLMQKMLGTELCSGSMMPKAGQSLAASELALISTWICQGARND
jgi:hypothetical protein